MAGPMIAAIPGVVTWFLALVTFIFRKLAFLNVLPILKIGVIVSTLIAFAVAFFVGLNLVMASIYVAFPSNVDLSFLSCIVPNNLDQALTAIATAHVAKWIYEFKATIAKAVMS